MTVRAYLRVSTDTQDHASQRSIIDEWEREKQRFSASYVTDHASGSIPWQQRSIAHVLEESEPGDCIVVSEISRIARSILGVLSFLAAASERGVEVVAIRSGITLDNSLSAKVVVTVLALAAEIERDLIRERTKAALQARKAAGLPLGRQRGTRMARLLAPRAKEIAQLLEAKVPKRAICRVLQCSPSTLYAYLKDDPGATGDTLTASLFPENQSGASSAAAE